MKIKFKPGEKVKTVSGKTCWINTADISSLWVTYNIWDGEDKFMNVDEWQIDAYEWKPIWFNVEI